ncbi:N-acetylmuramoyl-L-alanine amidase [Hyphomicrobium methylovorum]|uniref:N-acetylmuramoyl-L-alanine amidase n=1 Tax=Hyphomicrobium methylovorum TaxID=84 RepID=UPI001FE4436D|nr:N-acetylmuramoyl-L-alanine amidase [Hyphomicrobium methylovorum]
MRSLAHRVLRSTFALSLLMTFVMPSQAADVLAKAAAIANPDEVQLAVASPEGAPAVRQDSLRTRFVVGLERKVDYSVFAISHPNRVVIELPDVKLRLPSHDANKPVGLVKAFRAGLAAPGKTRIVIGVTEPVIVESANIEKGENGDSRLAVIIRPAANLSADESSAAAKAGATKNIQPPLPRPAVSPAERAERAARAFRPIIVLDPGHGGHDSGAEKLGVVEKNVVLQFGLVLRDLLEKSGRYKVMMTRDDDTFVPLDKRTAYAEHHKASLFIAIHADYAGGRSSARGATIYTLRDRVAKNLERSAQGSVADNVLSPDEINTVKEVSSDVGAVKSILADLAGRDVARTHDRTGMFAKAVIENMGESTPMRNDPDQQAAFRVLKTAQFPSVLIELAYVTNKADAANLKSDEWREKVAQSIADAIDNYFSHDIARLPM